MRGPRWARTARATVLDQGRSAPDRLGQGKATWVARPATVPCADHPISAQGVRRAQLLDIKATRELYLDPVDLSPLTTRVQVNGRTYEVRDVQAWSGVVRVLAEEV